MTQKDEVIQTLKQICEPIKYKRTHYCNELSEELDSETVILYGWVHKLRSLGKLKFVILRDRSGLVQITVHKNKVSKDVFDRVEQLKIESAIVVKGKVVKNPQAPKKFEIIPEDIQLVSITKSAPPIDITEAVPANLDTRLDNRPLDLRKPRISAIFKIQSTISNAIRQYFHENSFIEIHTPKIVAEATEGGANVFKVKYFEWDAYLAQSPQLYKQLMLVAGYDRVFEIAPAYRAEEHNTPRHINEYISIDAEIAWINSEEDVMRILEKGVKFAIDSVLNKNKDELELLGVEIKSPSVPFKRLKFTQVVDMLRDEGKELSYEDDLDTEGEKLLGKIMKERFNTELYFIKQYPEGVRPFYTMLDPEDPRYTRSFDLEFKGLEITTGGQRIHDYDLLIERIKAKNLNPKSFRFYAEFFKYGVPPHGGFGLGLERFTMKLLNLNNIREATLFPRTRTRVTP